MCEDHAHGLGGEVGERIADEHAAALSLDVALQSVRRIGEGDARALDDDVIGAGGSGGEDEVGAVGDGETGLDGEGPVGDGNVKAPAGSTVICGCRRCRGAGSAGTAVVCGDGALAM